MTPFLEKFHPNQTIPAFADALGISNSSKANILHLVAGNLFGGIERMLITIGLNANLCPRVKHSFAVCYSGVFSKVMRANGFSIHEFGKASFRNPFSLIFGRRNFRKYLSKNKFDWIICHGSWIHALFGRCIRNSGTSFAHMIHGISKSLSRQDQWSRLNFPDLVLANSQATLATAKMIFPEVRHKVVYPPCELTNGMAKPDLRIKIREEYRVQPGQFVIFSASRLEAGKGIDILIEGLGQIKDKPHWVCWVGGSPQRKSDSLYLNELKKIANRVGVGSRIRWLGHVEDMHGHFSAADVYCQPNRLPESFGITFVEAQSMGCPVITTGFGGALEVVEDNGINTLLAKPCPDFLAKALVKHLLIHGRHAVS